MIAAGICLIKMNAKLCSTVNRRDEMDKVANILREQEEISDQRHDAAIDAVHEVLKSKDKEILYLQEKIWELEAELSKE